MAVSVSNIGALQAVTADSKKLRWVESELAWFWSNPGGADTPDGVNIIAPTTGIGLWYRQGAKELSPNAWQWSTITSAPSTTVASKTKAYFCNSSSENPITIQLPATANIGDSIRICKVDISTWSRRIIIDRNGGKIDSLSSNIVFTSKNTDATLIYLNATIGWVVNTNYPYFAVSSITSLNYVSDGDTNGAFYWIGTNKNTVSWTNPAGTTPFLKTVIYPVAGSNQDTMTNSTICTDRASSDVFFGLATGGLFINLSADTYRPLRLVRFSVRTTSNSALMARTWRGFTIWGSTASGVITTPLSQIQYNNLNWTLLKSYTSNTTMPAIINTWAHYTIDSPYFFDTYRILATQPSGNNDYYYQFGEIELYGDAAW